MIYEFPIIAAMEHSLDVRAIREAKKMTQAQFAAAVGVDQATVSNWETGKTAPGGPAVKLMLALDAAAKERAA